MHAVVGMPQVSEGIDQPAICPSVLACGSLVRVTVLALTNSECIYSVMQQAITHTQ